MDPRAFRRPPGNCRAMTLWLWNDQPEPDRLRAQLRALRAGGCGAVLIRPGEGWTGSCAGEPWLGALELACETAGELGLRVWLEPSYRPNAVPGLPAEAQLEALELAGAGIPADATSVGAESEHPCLARRLELAANLLDPLAVQTYLKLACADTWALRLATHFGGVCEGLWVPSPEFQPGRPPWSQFLCERFVDRWGYRLEQRAGSLFEESGDYFRVRHHYWRTVLALLLEAWYREVAAWCRERHLKCGGNVLGDAHLASQVVQGMACMPAYEYLDLPATRHRTRSLNWPYLHGLGHYDRRFVLPPRQVGSVAHQLNKANAGIALYDGSPESLDFAQRRRLAAWNHAQGLNQRLLESCSLSLRGPRKRRQSPHLGEVQPWWPHNSLPGEEFDRLGWALRQGRHAADLLLLHPLETAYGLCPADGYDPHDPERTPLLLRELDEHFAELQEALLRLHIHFDLADETILARHARVANGRLEVGQMHYRIVLIPSVLTLRRTTVNLLNALHRAGGTLLAAGSRPRRIDGNSFPSPGDFNSRLTRIAGSMVGLRQGLAPLLRPRLVFEPRENDDGYLAVHERIVPEGRLFYVLHTHPDRPLAALVRWTDGDWGRFVALEHWDPASGERQTLPARREEAALTWELRLEPGEGILLLARTEDSRRAAEPAPAPRTRRREETLTGPWQLLAASPNALLLDTCSLRRDHGAWTPVLPLSGVRQWLGEDEPWAGQLSLAFEFELAPGLALPELCLVSEDAGCAAWRINGQAATYAGLPPWLDPGFLPIAIGPLLRPGRNRIEMDLEYRPGRDLEPLLLTGAFAVESRPAQSPAPAPYLRLSPGFVLTALPATLAAAELTGAGFPFFAGTLTLGRTLELPPLAPGEQLRLLLPAPAATVVQVWLNDVALPPRAWAPFAFDLGPHARPGRNDLRLALTGNLRNLLGPHHYPAGDPDDAAAGELLGSGRRDPETGREYPRWYLASDLETSAWTPDYVLAAFGLGEAPRLCFE